MSCAGHSVRHHLLGAYLRSLRAIVRAQFTPKGSRGGKQGALALLESNQAARVRL